MTHPVLDTRTTGAGGTSGYLSGHCSAGDTLDNIQYVFYHLRPLSLWAQHKQVQFTIQLHQTTLSNLINYIRRELLEFHFFFIFDNFFDLGTSRRDVQFQCKTKQGAKPHRAPKISTFAPNHDRAEVTNDVRKLLYPCIVTL